MLCSPPDVLILVLISLFFLILTNRSSTVATVPRRVRRLGKSVLKLIRKSLYYGVLVQIGMVQSKAVMCRLCKNILLGITAREFWALFALLLTIFTLLNWLIAGIGVRLFSSNPPVSKKTPLIYLYGNVAKQTRSGAVYGYM